MSREPSLHHDLLLTQIACYDNGYLREFQRNKYPKWSIGVLDSCSFITPSLHHSNTPIAFWDDFHVGTA